jgi:uncharacterized protein (TIGR04222 family)
LFDWLIDIPGPTFLVYYSMYVFMVIIIAAYVSYFDRTGKQEEPGISELEKYHIAALRGGTKEVIVTAAFSLWHKGLINLDGPDIQRKDKDVPVLDPIERAVYNDLQAPKTAASLVGSIPLGVSLEEYMESIDGNLEKLHLKPDKILCIG